MRRVSVPQNPPSSPPNPSKGLRAWKFLGIQRFRVGRLGDWVLGLGFMVDGFRVVRALGFWRYREQGLRLRVQRLLLA